MSKAVDSQPGEVKPENVEKMAKLYAKEAAMKVKKGMILPSKKSPPNKKG